MQKGVNFCIHKGIILSSNLFFNYCRISNVSHISRKETFAYYGKSRKSFFRKQFLSLKFDTFREFRELLQTLPRVTFSYLYVVLDMVCARLPADIFTVEMGRRGWYPLYPRILEDLERRKKKIKNYI